MLMTLFKILMSESATGLQKQLYALASFCEERQLTVNLSKTKVVVSEHRQSDMPDFVLSCGKGGELQVLGLCCTRHQSNDIWDKLSSGSGQEGDVCHAAVVCTSWHQGPCYAVQAI